MRKRFSVMAVVAAAALLPPTWTGGAPAAQDASNPVAALVRTLDVGKPVSHGNLTIVPVYARRTADRTPYVTLEDALNAGAVEIAELDGGSVPQVKISNLSKDILFLMAGEILTGGKQDRILAQDVLLAPGTRNLVVPVYCVEQGRWAVQSATFASKENLGTYRLRAKAAERAPAAQSQIWDEVQAQNRNLGIASGTSAYQAAFDNEENKAAIGAIEKKMKDDLRLADDTVGVVIGLGDRVIGADIFANPHLFRKQWPKILKSSALSSLHEKGRGELSQGAAAGFLKSLVGRDYARKPALDLGYELESGGGAAEMVKALVYREAVIHLAGFPQDPERKKVVEQSGPRMPVIRTPGRMR